MTAQAPNSHFDTSSEAQRRRALGRRGDRSKLARRFFNDLYHAWEEQGESAIARAAFHDPMGFVRVVASLMPQKLEVTHPTDGLTDERLAQLLELAERMAELRAQGLVAADEKRLINVTPEEGGGGPDRALDAPQRVVNPLPASAAATEPDNSSNKLVDAAVVDSTAESLIAEESNYATHPPVGRPFAPLEHDEKRANLKKLRSERDDIDPASLF